MTKSSQNDDEKILFTRTPNSQRLTIIVIYNMFKILNGNMNSEIQWGQYIHGLIYNVTLVANKQCTHSIMVLENIRLVISFSEATNN